MSKLPSICEMVNPDHYYKVINYLSHNQQEVYIFVGQHEVEVRQMLTKIEQNTKLSATDHTMLESIFGQDYQKKLALEGQWSHSQKYYIDNLIEADDSILAIKSKISVYLKLAIDWQYLYAKVKIKEVNQTQESYICLGHTFVERSENKKTEGAIIDYVKDPYLPIDLVHPSINYFIDPVTGIRFVGYQKNDTNGSLISEYLVVDDEIYLVTICNYLKYFRSLKTPYTGTNLLKFRWGYLARYWATLVLENESQYNDIYEACGGQVSDGQAIQDKFVLSQEYKNLVASVDRDRYIVSLIKSPLPQAKVAKVEFTDCGLMEIVLHINYANSPDQGDFIDLVKVFNQYQLNSRTPFVKYRDEKTKEPRHKLYKPIVDENSMEIIQDWVSNIQKKRKDDNVEYRISGRGLSFKRLLYQNVDKSENKYATINFYKNGKIELKCFWEESKKANLSDIIGALIDLVSLVNEINQIEYHLPGINRKLRIPIPNLTNAPDFWQPNSNSNIQIAFINSVSQINYGALINFDQLNNFTACFNTFVSIIPKNKVLELDPVTGQNVYKTVMSTALQLRYKRISNYMKMSEVEKFIHDIIKNTEGVDKMTIIKVLSGRFNVVQDVADKIYTAYESTQQIAMDKKDEKFTNLDYVLGKKIKKQPGIDIKIQGQESDKYKIFILGAKNFFQLSMIHRFLRNLVRLFKVYDVISNDSVFKSYVNQGLCQLPENLIDEGIDQSIQTYQMLEKKKKKQKLVSKAAEELGLENLEESDINDVMAFLAGEDIEDVDADADEPSDTELTEGELEEIDDLEDDLPETELDEDGNPTAIPPPSKPVAKMSFDYTKKVSALSRLQDADPELFKNSKYATRCQSNVFRQPMVVSETLHDTKKKEIEEHLKTLTEHETNLLKTKPENYKKLLEEIVVAKTHLTEQKLIYKQGVGYRGHYYFCPRTYEYSTERMLNPDEIIIGADGIERDKKTGNPIYSTGSSEGKGQFLHAGFAPQSVHPDNNACPVCCYSKPKTNYDTCLSQGVDQVQNKSNLKFILAAEKTGIPMNRYGILPEVLNIIFNQKKKQKNENKIMSGFDMYLRKGVSQNPVQNVFLNAIGDAMQPPMTGQQIRKQLVSKLTMPVFLTLKSGSLRLIFGQIQSDKSNKLDKHTNKSKNNADTIALANFSDFLLKDNLVNEDLLWDYLTLPGILRPEGFNLFIFESQSVKNRISENINLKCPIGYEILDLYGEHKSSLVLLKYSQRYEPVYRVTDNGTMMKIYEMLEPYHPIIKTILPKMGQCHPVIDNQAYNQAKLLMQIKNKSTGPLGEELDKPSKTAKQTIDGLNQLSEHAQGHLFKPKSQLIDDYNKTVYLVLENNLKLPVKPSSRLYNYPIGDYNQFPPLTYLETFDGLHLINDFTNIPSKPIVALVDDQLGVIGILLNNGLSVEIQPLLLSDFKLLPKDKRLTTSEQYYRSRNLVDEAIAQSQSTPQVDDRVHYVSLRQFEDESYQRLRYELSKSLQKSTDLVDQIQELVADKLLSVNERRHRLGNLLQPVIQSLTINQRSKPYNYDQYQIPNVRKPCMTQSVNECQVDPHCEVNSKTQECQLLIEPKNLLDSTKDNMNRYLSLIVEELLKNHLKRNEILNDQVDNTIDDTIFEYRQEEQIFRDVSHKDNKRKLESLYKMDVDYYDRLSKLYDIANPLNHSDYSPIQNLAMSKLLGSSCNQGFEPLSIYWVHKTGPNFRRMANNNTSDCIYYALSLALNQRELKKSTDQIHTIETIRDSVADNITHLKDEIDVKTGAIKRLGWQSLLDHLRFIYKEVVSHIYSESELKNYMMSQSHYLSLIDLIMISQIYDIKFMIMSSKGTSENQTRFICLGSTTNLNDDYILIYKIDAYEFQIIGNVGFSPPKYIFSKEELPATLYQTWVQVCHATDLKSKPDDYIPLLFNAPLYTSFDIGSELDGKIKLKAISSKSYFTDPHTNEILPQQNTKKIPIPYKVKPNEVQDNLEIEKIKLQALNFVKKAKIPVHMKSDFIIPSKPTQPEPIQPEPIQPEPIPSEPIPISKTIKIVNKTPQIINIKPEPEPEPIPVKIIPPTTITKIKIPHKDKTCKLEDSKATTTGYVCNPDTGNWVQVNGDAGKKIITNYPHETLKFSESIEPVVVPKKPILKKPTITKIKIPHKDKTCKLEDSKATTTGYVCNPDTGNWVQVNGDAGKKIITNYPQEALKFSNGTEPIIVSKKPILKKSTKVIIKPKK